VLIVGLGGTGSMVVQLIARLDYALQKLGHKGLEVTLLDGDKVSDSNVGRQLYSDVDIGYHKAIVQADRINRFYNFDYHPECKYLNNGNANKLITEHEIVITCVDKVAPRFIVHNNHEQFKDNRRYYKNHYLWLDFGNGLDYGQAILSDANIMKSVIQMYPNMVDDQTAPSCSLAEALNRQDLFINNAIAIFGIDLLYKLLTHFVIQFQGIYLNLSTPETTKIPIYAREEREGQDKPKGIIG
jgi:PRTRC genetic system ThiF family protein